MRDDRVDPADYPHQSLRTLVIITLVNVAM